MLIIAGKRQEPAPQKPRAPKPRRIAGLEGSPFVTFPGWIRRIVLGLLGAHAIVCVTGALMQSGVNSASGYLAFSDVVYFAALALPFVVYDEKKDGWFQPLVFTSLMMIVRYLWRRTGLMIYGLEEHAVIPLDEEGLTRLVAFENLMIGLSLFSMQAGYHALREPFLPRWRLGMPRRIPLAVSVIALFGLAAMAMMVKLSGGFSQLILNLSLNGGAKVFVEDATIMGVVAAVAQWMALVMAIVVAYKPARLKNVLFIGVCAFAFGMAFVATGKRSLLIGPIVVMAITWMMTRRSVPLGRLALLGGGLFVMFTGLLVFRAASQGSRSIDDVKAAFTEKADDASTSGIDELTYRIGGYSSSLAVYHFVPESSPLLFGEGYLNLVGRPIPRSLWPTKPRGMAFRAGSMFFGAIWGIPPGGVAEAYWNFHIPGVIAVYGLFGALLKWAASMTLRYRKHGIAIFLYSYTLFSLQPDELSVTYFMQALLPIALFCVITGIAGPFKTVSRGWQS